ncbi:MAG: helicase-exonuclease AddAB subunit AddA [Phycisphaerae bacterium]
MPSPKKPSESGGIAFTPAQKQAIETVGRNLVVTAAAGSGKTAVLAERCAHLVCDLPTAQRCGVDGLCVVTFTDAAAAEMKSRILEAIRARARQRPGDAYLRSQAALIDTAQISTLHAFCLWMLRRWFSEASIDPAATLLQAEEARLLRAETVESLFEELYDASDELGYSFTRLIDEYGLGKDDAIAKAVLELADFVRSLPDPQGWLDRARRSVSQGADQTLAWFDDRLRDEIDRQHEQVQAIAAFIQQELPIARLYGDKLEAYADALAGWSSSDYQAVRRAISDYKVSAGSGVRKNKSMDDAEVAQIETARDLFKRIKDHLFDKHLLPLARFSRDQALAGLQAVSPHVSTLCRLAQVFAERYQQAKTDLDVLDFADLEHGAYQLLTGPPTSTEPRTSVRAALRERFAYVLVDEFQDINPLQAEILTLVSRDEQPDQPGNFFCVGDVKQSIYRFRLAEPAVLQQRVDQAQRQQSQAGCIALQDNFRSVPPLIDGLNLLFERLMSRRIGGVDYDDLARLRPGLADPQTGPGAVPPIELHVLERRLQDDNHRGDSDYGPQVDPTDPAQWASIEREAYLIGQLILDLRARSEQAGGAPVPWDDMAVLMRATRYTAGPMADMLRRMGIPAQADAGEALLGSTEVRDVLALLDVLDNPMQDIPLAAVLRSGVTGMALTEDDLVALRCHDKAVPFHRAVQDYGRAGADDALQERLGRILNRLDLWRRRIRLRPLAEVLWSIYQESGYLAYVGGLPHGTDRRANLLALHGRARQFGGFKRQGLHRFLRFVDSLADSGQDLLAKPTAGRGGDAVRIMSIHGSKGLEFDTVFVADLGKQFNLRDKHGRIIYDRDSGIGLRVVEPERMIEYPSIAHLRVADSIETATRDEEMRILYVALTRAKRKLFLVGSANLNQVDATRRLWSRIGAALGTPAAPPSRTPLEWIVPALATAPSDRVAWVHDGPSKQPASPLYRVWCHDAEAVGEWEVPADRSASECHTLASVSALQPLPGNEPLPDDPAEVSAVLDRLNFTYPHLAASSIRAVMGASEAKRAVDPFEEGHKPITGPATPPVMERPKVLESAADSPSSLRRGTLTHLVLEAWDFATPARQVVSRLVESGMIESAEADAVDTRSLEWFATTDLAQTLRRAGPDYRREVRFVSTEPATGFDPTLEGLDDEKVLIRGIVDGVWVTPEALEIVDFKTDAIGPDEVPERALRYEMQMRLYASAVSRIWKKPVARGVLVFLTPGRIIEVNLERSGSCTS